MAANNKRTYRHLHLYQLMRSFCWYAEIIPGGDCYCSLRYFRDCVRRRAKAPFSLRSMRLEASAASLTKAQLRYGADFELSDDAHMSTRQKAIATTIEDNVRVRVTEWRFAPNTETGWHTHALDYVVVYGSAGQLLAETKEGPITVQVRAGQSYFRNAGMEHNIVNSGNEDLVFVETELK